MIPTRILTMSQRYKVVVFAPLNQGDRIKQAAFEQGAGRIGLYSGCAFTLQGHGQFIPDEEANPEIGKPGNPEVVEELRIEVEVKGEEAARRVVTAVKEAHPYEEAVVDVYKLEEF